MNMKAANNRVDRQRESLCGLLLHTLSCSCQTFVTNHSRDLQKPPAALKLPPEMLNPAQN